MIGNRAFPALLTLLFAGDLIAQDAHYWTYQYGTRANLLSGAVVGSVVDLSASYYNPGALTLIEEPDLIATQKVFELSNVIFEPEAGFDFDFDHLRLDLAPGFVAGILPFKFLRNHVLAYSIFTRQLFKTSLDRVEVGRLEEFSDTLSGDFFAQARFQRDLNESWAGLSWSFPLAGKIGFGLSLFGAYRSQKGSDHVQAQTVTEPGGFNIALTESAFSYWHFRMLLKAGVTFEWLGASLGLTVTAPGLGLFGDGRVLLNRTLSASDTIFVADYQDGLSPEYRSPWSIGFGGALKRGPTVLHLTTEWFSRVGEHTVLDPEDFIGQTTGDTISIRLTQALDPLLNLGVGLQHSFKPHFTGYASFRTDYSAKPSDSPNNISTAAWNIFFVTVGAAVQIASADLTLGLAFGWGHRDEEQTGGAPLLDGSAVSPVTADLKYRSLRAIIALAI